MKILNKNYLNYQNITKDPIIKKVFFLYKSLISRNVGMEWWTQIWTLICVTFHLIPKLPSNCYDIKLWKIMKNHEISSTQYHGFQIFVLEISIFRGLGFETFTCKILYPTHIIYLTAYSLYFLLFKCFPLYVSNNINIMVISFRIPA